MEQGRVSDAARVGQSTDPFMAPLFLLCFCLSQLLLFCFLTLMSWIFTDFSLFFFVHLLRVPSLSRDFGVMLLHISLKMTSFV